MSRIFKSMVPAVLAVAVPAWGVADERRFEPEPQSAVEKALAQSAGEFRSTEFPEQPDGTSAFAQFIRIARTRVLQSGEHAALRARLSALESNPALGPVSAGLSREDSAAIIRAFIRIRYNDDAAWSLSRFIKFQTSRRQLPVREDPEFDGAFKFLADLAGRLKLKFRDLERQFAEISIAGGEPPLGVVGHMDVVAAEEPGWRHPPFSGAIADGFIWGRGAQDGKGAVISAIYAMAGLQDARVNLKNRVTLLVGTAEETTWEDVDYLIRRYGLPPLNLIIDAEFPAVFGEKGLVVFRISTAVAAREKCGRGWEIAYTEGGTQATMVPDRADFSVRNPGRPREAALKELAELIDKHMKRRPGSMVSLAVGDDGMELKFSGATANAMNPGAGRNAIADMVEFTIEGLGVPDGGRGCMMKFLAGHVGRSTDGSGLGINRSHPILGDTTVNLGTWREGNGSASTLTVELNLRFPTGLGIDEIKTEMDRRIRKFNEKTGCQLSASARGLPPVLSDTNSEIVRALVYSFRAATGIEAAPVATGGTSYAKVFPNAFPFGPLFPGQERLEHSVNERIPSAQITQNAGIYATAMIMLAGRP